jgi:hypothetical protein
MKKVSKITSLLLFATLLLVQMDPVSMATPSSADISSWQETISRVSTPGPGCWTASYPSLAWSAGKCANSTISQSDIAMIGLFHNDENDTFSSASNTFSSVYFTSESGFSSEYDNYSRGCSGSSYDWYSIQVNTNEFATSAYGGTRGWEQFIFQNQGCPNYNKGILYVTYDLVGYLTGHSSCPSGWTALFGSCYLASPSPPTQTPYLDPSKLTSAHVYGQTGAYDDNAELCISGTCYSATSGSDYLGLYPNKWANTEANIFGYAGLSQAVFNSGFSLGLKINNIGSTTASCSQTLSTSGETANLNLGSCSYTSSSISWSEHS